MNRWNQQRGGYNNHNFKSGGGYSENTLYVSGIPPEFSSFAFQNMFERYGTVVFMKHYPPRRENIPRVGMIGYKSAREAQAAMAELHGSGIGGYQLSVVPARDQNQRKNKEVIDKVDKGELIDANAQSMMREAQQKFEQSQNRSNDYSKQEKYLKNPLISSSKNGRQSPSNHNTSLYANSRGKSFQGRPSRSPRSSSSSSSNTASLNRGISPVSENTKKTYTTSEVTDEFRPCQICGKSTSTYCKNCKVTYYCSVDCQKQDWGKHKQSCKKKATEQLHDASFDNQSFTTELNEELCKELAENLKNTLKLRSEKVTILPFDEKVKSGSLFDLLAIDVDRESAYIVCQNSNPNSFKTLLQLQKDLNSSYNTKPGKVLKSPAVGDACVAQFTEDRQWYRAKVMQLCEGNSMLIKYVDYGNCEIKEADLLYVIEEKFCQLSAFSLLCKLADTNNAVGWSDKQVQFIADALEQNDMLLQAKVVNIEGDFLMVQVKIGDIALNDKINRLTPLKSSLTNNYSKTSQSPVSSNNSFENKLSPPPLSSKSPKDDFSPKMSKAPKHISSPVSSNKKTSSEVKMPASTSEAPSGINVTSKIKTDSVHRVEVPEDTFDAFISHIESPNCFYCQVVADDFVQLHNYLPELSEHFSLESNKVDYKPDVGDLCAALFSEDQQWYRGEILEGVTADSYKVKYIDFGNSANVSRNNIQPLPQKYQSLPIQSFKASLDSCLPVNDQWSDDAIDFFKNFRDSSCKATVVKNSNDVVSLLLHLNETKTFNDDFISRGFAISKIQAVNEGIEPQKECSKLSLISLDSYTPSYNKKVQIVITSLYKTGGFFCQVINKQTEQLQKLTLHLSTKCPQIKVPPRGKIYKGLYCAAYFEKRHCWCRAVVINIKEALIQLRLVDYGNSMWIVDKELRLLPDDVKEPPMLAFPCVLVDVEPVSETWSDDYSNTIFNVLEKNFDAMFIGKKGVDFLIKVPDIVNMLILQNVARYSFTIE